MGPCRIHHSPHTVFASDISGIDPDLVSAVFDGCYSHPVIKMNVCHQGNGNLFFDLLYSPGRLHSRNGHPDDLASGRLQPMDLFHRFLHIFRLCIAHGLNGNGISSADHAVPDAHRPGLLSCRHSSAPPSSLEMYFSSGPFKAKSDPEVRCSAS